MSAPAWPWLKASQVAELLGVDVTTAYRWMQKGDPRGIVLRSVRIGKRNTRCRADWVDRFAKGEQVPIEETLPPKPTVDTTTARPGPRARW